MNNRKKPRLMWFRFWKKVATNWTEWSCTTVIGTRVKVEFCDN